MLSSECSACGARFTSGSQHDENLKRLDLRRAEYGDVLLGEDIVAFRMRYGITQTAAAKIFGKSKIAFSRLNRALLPDAASQASASGDGVAQVLKEAASDAAGVRFPLWEARCADERKTKVVELIASSAKPQGTRFWEQVPRHDLSSADLIGDGPFGVMYAPAANDEVHSVEAQAS
ncbi:MAG: hypothetical protein H6643_09000 [Caldilineaceae bacterium]|nr:hypothetical protein [Caldilineaceae bacterium]